MVNRIKEIREKFFKTQANMAAILGVSRQAVNEYERGNNIIPTKALILLSSKYNININWLLTGQGNMLLSDDDKVNNDELIQQQDRIKELQAQVDLLKELLQSNNKQS